jgi:hypothetical protein
VKHPVSFSLLEPLPPIDPFIEKVALLGTKQWVLGADDDIRESGRLPGPRYACHATIHSNNINARRLVHRSLFNVLGKRALRIVTMKCMYKKVKPQNLFSSFNLIHLPPSVFFIFVPRLAV